MRQKRGEIDIAGRRMWEPWVNIFIVYIVYIQLNNLTIDAENRQEKHENVFGTFERRCTVAHTVASSALCARARDKCTPAGLKSTRGLLIRREPLSRALLSFCSPPHLCADISLSTLASFSDLPSLGFGSPFHDRSQKFATAHCDGN